MVILIIVLLAVSTVSVIAFVIKQIEIKKMQEDYEMIIRQYKKLSELNQKKKALIGMAAHDVSTPLASIDMWAQLLKNSGDGLNADQMKSIDMITDASQYGQRLIRKMIELENVIPEKIAIENIDFSSLVSATTAKQKLLLKNGVQLILNNEAEVFLLSDKSMIKKMCEALLSDVVNNAKANSEIEMNLDKGKGEIVFQIKYNAVDISKSKLSNLFSDYKQISSSTEEAVAISNLTIAQRIVEELGGHIFSQNNENGNTIIIVKFKNG